MARKEMESPMKGVKESDPTPAFAGGYEKVVDEAKKRKRGGRVKAKAMGGVVGAAAKPRLDRPAPGRKRGGRVGADMAPLSSANRVTSEDKGSE